MSRRIWAIIFFLQEMSSADGFVGHLATTWPGASRQKGSMSLRKRASVQSLIHIDRMHVFQLFGRPLTQ